MKKSNQSVIIPLLVLLLIKFMPAVVFVSATCIGFLIVAAILHFSGYEEFIVIAWLPAIAFGYFVKSRTKVASRFETDSENENT